MKLASGELVKTKTVVSVRASYEKFRRRGGFHLVVFKYVDMAKQTFFVKHS